MRKDDSYLVGLLLIISFATWFTWYLDDKTKQVWGANWMGSAEWAHPLLLLVTSVCVTGSSSPCGEPSTSRRGGARSEERDRSPATHCAGTLLFRCWPYW
jgi:hypothetical protein